MPTEKYDVFISYRREGGDAQALFIREKLLQKGLRVFLDVADLRKGYFDQILLEYIADAPNFIVILSPRSLDRCEEPGDYLRQEIEQAVKTNRNIIPVMMTGFSFPRQLPDEIKTLPRHQGVEYSHAYFEAMIGRIVESVEAERAERREQEKLIMAERAPYRTADSALTAAKQKPLAREAAKAEVAAKGKTGTPEGAEPRVLERTPPVRPTEQAVAQKPTRELPRYQRDRKAWALLAGMLGAILVGYLIVLFTDSPTDVAGRIFCLVAIVGSGGFLLYLFTKFPRRPG